MTSGITNAAGITAVAGGGGGAVGKQGLWIPASGMVQTVTNPAVYTVQNFTSPAGVNNFGLMGFAFQAANNLLAQFPLVFPSNWNLGTLSFVPYWTALAGTVTQTVVWQVKAIAFRDDDTLNTQISTATLQSSTDALLATSDLHIGPESAAITVAGTPASGGLVLGQITRTTSTDTLSVTAYLIGMMLYYTTV